MTQEQNQPPAAPTASREDAISRNPDQPTAHPTLRDRLRYGRLLRLTAADWHALIWLVVLTAGGNVLLIDQIRQAPISLHLTLPALSLGNLLAGALLAYTLLRRLLEDQIATSSEVLRTSSALLDRYDQTVTEAHHLLATTKRALADAFDAGQQEALAQATQTYERQIATLAAEIAALRQAPGYAERDQMDVYILTLLASDPQPTDAQIGQIVGLSASQVLIRRRRLAAAGYEVAQKRPGRRSHTGGAKF